MGQSERILFFGDHSEDVEEEDEDKLQPIFAPTELSEISKIFEGPGLRQEHRHSRSRWPQLSPSSLLTKLREDISSRLWRELEIPGKNSSPLNINHVPHNTTPSRATEEFGLTPTMHRVRDSMVCGTPKFPILKRNKNVLCVQVGKVTALALYDPRAEVTLMTTSIFNQVKRFGTHQSGPGLSSMGGTSLSWSELHVCLPLNSV